jgi:hypothetical protein
MSHVFETSFSAFQFGFFFFSENTRAISDKPGGSFHYDISQNDKGLSEKWCPTCWLNTTGETKGDTNWRKQEAKEDEVIV